MSLAAKTKERPAMASKIKNAIKHICKNYPDAVIDTVAFIVFASIAMYGCANMCAELQ